MTTPHTFTNPLQELVAQLGSAEQTLRCAASLCPGDVAMQAGLLQRADWLHAQFNTALTRAQHGLTRRQGDNPRSV